MVCFLAQVKHWTREDYGKFYNGDSYIILNTYKEKDSEVASYNNVLQQHTHIY